MVHHGRPTVWLGLWLVRAHARCSGLNKQMDLVVYLCLTRGPRGYQTPNTSSTICRTCVWRFGHLADPCKTWRPQSWLAWKSPNTLDEVELCTKPTQGWSAPERSNLIIFEISVKLVRKYFAYGGRVGVLNNQAWMRDWHSLSWLKLECSVNNTGVVDWPLLVCCSSREEVTIVVFYARRVPWMLTQQSYSCATLNVDWIYEWMATFSTFDAMSRWLHSSLKFS